MHTQNFLHTHTLSLSLLPPFHTHTHTHSSLTHTAPPCISSGAERTVIRNSHIRTHKLSRIHTLSLSLSFNFPLHTHTHSHTHPIPPASPTQPPPALVVGEAALSFENVDLHGKVERVYMCVCVWWFVLVCILTCLPILWRSRWVCVCVCVSHEPTFANVASARQDRESIHVRVCVVIRMGLHIDMWICTARYTFAKVGLWLNWLETTPTHDSIDFKQH